MKFAADRPWSDTEKAARKLLENDVEVVQDGRIYIEDKLASIWRSSARAEPLSDSRLQPKGRVLSHVQFAMRR